MGIYDRDYTRRDDYGYGHRPGIHLGGPRTLTTDLVLVMVGVYVVQVLTRGNGPDGGWFTETFSLSSDVWRRPWECFQLLTYGFLHSPRDMWHIVFNMLVLWLFGRVVEYRYGRQEYLCFFLVAVVFAGLVWCVSENLALGARQSTAMLGASGGLAAVLLLFALNFPHQQVFIWGVLPMPAWVFAILFVGYDLWGAVQRSGNVAYTAHLGGALFAFLYFRSGWRIMNWLPRGISLPRPRRGPKLRVHQPRDDDHETESRLDDILRKIQEQGQDSLSREERRFLEQASREYQRKNR